MGDGLKLAYQHAVKHAGPKTVSRVIVLTDGDTNLGRFRTRGRDAGEQCAATCRRA